jgi:hypothetical protein
MIEKSIGILTSANPFYIFPKKTPGKKFAVLSRQVPNPFGGEHGTRSIIPAWNGCQEA